MACLAYPPAPIGDPRGAEERAGGETVQRSIRTHRMTMGRPFVAAIAVPEAAIAVGDNIVESSLTAAIGPTPRLGRGCLAVVVWPADSLPGYYERKFATLRG